MALVLVEVTDEALERLTQNADVRVVGILTKPAPTAPLVAPAPRKWAGSLSEADAASWDKHLTEIRTEWERSI